MIHYKPKGQGCKAAGSQVGMLQVVQVACCKWQTRSIEITSSIERTGYPTNVVVAYKLPCDICRINRYI